MLRAAIVALLAGGLVLAQDPDAILKHVNDALGWPGRFASTNSLKIEGTLDGGALTVYARQPSLFRLELAVGKDLIIQAYDGSFGWMEITGQHPQPPKRLNGRPLDRLIDQATHAIGGPLVNTAQRGARVDFEGAEKTGEQSYLKLKLTLITGTVIHSYIDAATDLEAREVIETGDSTIDPIDETVSDYRKFNGILFPCLFVSRSKGDTKAHELKINQVSFNNPLPSSLFNIPVNAINIPKEP